MNTRFLRSLVALFIASAGLLNAQTAPNITTQPQSQTVTVDANAMFSVVATGTPPLSYVWRKGGTPLTDNRNISGTGTATLTLTGVGIGDAGEYTVIINNDVGTPATSNTATLTITSEPGFSGWWQAEENASDATGHNAAGALLGGTTFGAGKLGQAFVFDGVDGWVDLGTNTGDFGTGDFTITFWVRFDNVSGEQIVIEKYIETESVLRTGWSLGMMDGALYFGFDGGRQLNSTAMAAAAWHHVAVTRTGNAFTMYLDGTATQGGTYTPSFSSTASLKLGHRGNPTDTPGSVDPRGFFLSGALDEVRIYARGLSAGEIQTLRVVPPSIPTQPQSQTVNIGANVTFSVAAGGTPPLTYQWRKDGAALSGATNASLTIQNVQPADVGYYTVVVTDSSGSTTSAEAALNLPTIPIAATAGNEWGSGVAFDGTNFLVGIQGDAALHTSVTAQLVSQTGTLVGSRISTGRTGGMPLVAFDGTNYLMVWEDDVLQPVKRLYGAFVSPGGALVGSPFAFPVRAGASTKQSPQGMAFDGTNYLVLYTDSHPGEWPDLGGDYYNSSNMCGRFVTTAGNVGDEFILATNAKGTLQAVAWNGSTYLAAWPAHIGGNQNIVQGRLISSAGVMSDVITVTGTVSPSHNPLSVATDGANFLVVWNHDTGPGYPAETIWELRGRVVTPAGGFLGAEFTLAGPAGSPMLPVIAFDGTCYLVTWTEQHPDPNGLDVAGCYIGAGGTPVGTAFNLVVGAGNQALSPVIRAGNQCLLVWTDGFSMDGSLSGDVRGMLLAGSGGSGTAPTITSFTPAAIGRGLTVVITGTNFTGATGVLFNGTPAQSFTVDSPTQITAIVPWTTPVDGPISITTPSGTAASTGHFTSTLAPIITGFSPTTGPVNSMVLITGANFLQPQMSFNGVTYTSLNWNENALLLPVPVSATTGPITVQTQHGSVTTGTDFVVAGGSPPANDAYANAQPITGASGTVPVSNVNATKETGEPDHAGNSGGASVWYAWTAPQSGLFLFNPFHSPWTENSFSVRLGIYTGSAIDALTPVAGSATSNEMSAPSFANAAVLDAAAGVTYLIAIDGRGGIMGNCQLEWSPLLPPTITNIWPTTAYAGQEIMAMGTGYEPGATLAICGVTTNPARTQVTSPTQINGAPVPSTVPLGPASITVTTAAGTVSSSLVLTITEAPAPTIQSFSPSSGAVGTWVSINGTALALGDVPPVVKFNGTPVSSVSDYSTNLGVYVPTGATTGPITVETSKGLATSATNFMVNLPPPTVTGFTPATFTAGMTVTITGTNFSGATSVQFNGVAASVYTVNSSAQITATVPGTALTNGTITVSTANGTAASGGTFVYSAAPMITVQPAGSIVTAGVSQRLSVTAFGQGSLNYQWYMDGVPIAGATLPVLTINQAQSGNNGDYTVMVSNGGGDVTSSVAKLRVAPHEPYTISTLAGQANIGSNDGTGLVARVNRPTGVAVDASGNIYIADSSNYTIRKMSLGGEVSTFAGLAGYQGAADGTGSAARFIWPEGITIDSAGNLFVADVLAHTIRKITPGGTVTTVAGLAGCIGSVDGTGSAARFNLPTGVAVDESGQIYVADMSNRTIRKISPAGEVTTLAGAAGGTGSGADGTGSAARFGNPRDVVIDASGNICVADGNTIRKLTPAGVVTTLAGLAGSPGTADGNASTARFRTLTGITIHGNDLYVSDSSASTIRKVTPTGEVTTLAGLALTNGSMDGTGTAARFWSPFKVAADSTGQLFVADRLNSTVRKVTLEGVVTTVVGLPPATGSTDGTGSAARFSSPADVAVDASGNAYVADSSNHVIRKVTPAGVVTTVLGLAGSSGSADGIGSIVRFNAPIGVALGATGVAYVADSGNHTIRKIAPDGMVTTFAGTAGASGNVDGTGSAARFNTPSGVAVDASGNIFVTDTANHTIRKITPDGVVTTVAGLTGSSGSVDGTGPAARFYLPWGIAVNAAGNLYVAERGNYTIRVITPDGTVSTLIGGLNILLGVAADDSGNVYVLTSLGFLAKITPTGTLTALAGLSGVTGSADGTGSSARFSGSGGIEVDGAGKIYIADTGNNTIRIGTLPGSPPVITTPPVSQTVSLDADVTFTVEASGTLPLHFNWMRNDYGLEDVGNITGANSASLTITHVLPGDAGVYHVVVTNANGETINSGTATLTINLPDGFPVITGQPQSVRLSSGNTATLTVTATGEAPLSYQWRKGGVDIPGATNTTLVLADARSSDVGRYDVVVSNAVGLNTSAPAFVAGNRSVFDGHTYELTPSTMNWNEAEAWAVTRGGHLVAINSQAEQDFLEGFFGAGGNLWIGLTDQATESVWTTWSSGEPVTYSNWHAGEPNNAWGDEDCALMYWASQLNTTKWNDVPGSQIFGVVEYDFIADPAITVQPVSLTANTGDNVIFTVTAAGQGIQYQWFFNGLPVSGATGATLTLNNVQPGAGGSYAVTITNAFGSTTSQVVTLSGNNPAPTITAQPQNVTVTSGQPATLSVTANGVNLGYQWRRNGVPIASATGASHTINPAVRADADFYDVIAYSGLSPAISQTVRLSVAPTSYPGLLVNDPAANLKLTRSWGEAYTVVIASDGKFYVGGDFVSIDGQPRTNLARFNADGTLDGSFVPPKLNGRVGAVLPLADGRVLIGGDFYNLAGVNHTFNGLVCLTAGGLLDESMLFPGIFASVYTLAGQTDGKILVGGNFGGGGGTPGGLARFNADGSLDAAFNASVSFGHVRHVELQADGKIMIGGGFTSVGGQTRNRVARLNSDGTLDTSFDPGSGANGEVNQVKMLGDGRYVLVGRFTNYAGTSVGHLAQLLANGSLDPTYNAGAGADDILADVVVLTGDQLLISGYLHQYNGTPRDYLARLNADGTLDPGFDASCFGGMVGAVARQTDGRLVVAGSFSAIGGGNRQGLARLMADGALDPSVNSTPVYAAQVKAMINAPDGKLVIAGNFTALDGTVANRIARLNADGSPDNTFDTGSGPDGDVNQILRAPDGKLLIIGGFTSINGVSRAGVARLNPDGSLDAAYNAGIFEPVWTEDATAVLMPGGRLLFPSAQSMWGGVPVYGLIALNPDGTRDTGFNIGTGVGQGSSAIRALAVQADGKVLVGGWFTEFNGQSCGRLLRLNTDGSIDPSFVIGSGFNGQVSVVRIQSDGKVLVGGWFNQFNGQNRNRLARLNPDGSLDATFGSANPDNGVECLLLQEDGRLLIAGWFSSVSGAPGTRYLARLKDDGSLDDTFRVTGQDSVPELLALTDNGVLYSATRSTPANNDGLVRNVPGSAAGIAVAPVSQTATPGDTVTFSVTASGTPAPTYQWNLNGVPIAGATGATLMVSNVQSQNGGSYTVTVTNTFGSATSPTATLSGPNPAPTITTQPAVVVARSGGAASLSVGATGAGLLTYQWNRHGQPIAGATGATLSLTNLTIADTGRYDVVIHDGLSMTTAQPGWVIVQTSPGLLWAQGAVALGFASYRAIPEVVFDGVASIAGGDGHSLFLRSDGSLWTTGVNGTGQLGDGTTTNRSTPIQVASGVASVAAGGTHTLFLKSDGTLWATGNNFNGQLGDGTTISRSTPEQVASGVTAVAAGGNHTLFVQNDGILWAMGYNQNGQLGDGTTTNRSTPVQVASGVTAVAAGGNHTLFRKSDGTLWAMGGNESGQLGDGTTTNRSTPVQVVSGVSAVAAGGSHSLFLKPDGTLWAMGNNLAGQLGDGTTINHSTPVQITGGVASVVAGGGHTLFRRPDGTLWAMGSNDSGQLGDGTTTNRSTPVQIASEVVCYDAGGGYTFYGKGNGRLWATGANGLGQLGDGSMSPVGASALLGEDVVAAAAGYNTSLFVKSDGSLWKQKVNQISQVPGVSGVVAVAVGGYDFHRLYLKNDGTLWLLAEDDTSTQVADDVVDCGAGLEYMAYLKSDGTLWGQNFTTPPTFGWIRFGDGVNPGQVADHVESISAAGWHMLYVKNDGTLWGMGLMWGGFGDQAAWPDWNQYWVAHVADPIQLETGILAAVANANWNEYLKADGSMWTRGSNWSGNGTAVAADGGIIAMTGENSRSLYVKTDGTLWARSGHEGALGAPGQLTGGVTGVATGTDVTFLFTQQAGHGTVPEITSQPQSATVGAGVAVVLEVSASGTSPLDFQWFKDGVVILGAKNAQYPIVYPTSEDAGNYTVTITNSAGSVTSAAATLTVSEPPAVVSQTPWQAVFAGNNASFGVTTSGPITGYQWQISTDGGTTWSDLSDETGYAGATTATLTVNGVTAGMNGRQFHCVIAGPYGTVTSAAAALNLAPALPAPGVAWVHGPGIVTGLISELHPQPRIVAGQVISAFAGGNDSFFLTSDGTLRAMGQNGAGQLGDGTTADQKLPVPSLAAVVAVATSGTHTLFVKADGTLWAAGDNTNGQLGDGTTTARPAPVQVTSGVSAAAVGFVHSLFLKTDGTLWATGGNDSGQLGDGTTTERHTPIQVASGVTFIAAGGRQSYYVTSDATLWAVGWNNVGQLGDGSMTDRHTPVQIATGVRSVAAAASHVVFIKQDDTLWTAGLNGSGQLADGTTVNRSAPQSVATGVVRAVASYRTLYLKTDGTLWGTSPDGVEQVATDVASFAEGGGHDSFVKTDGTLWSMGGNTNGQLGNGLTNPEFGRLGSEAIAMGVGFSDSAFAESDGTLWRQKNGTITQVPGVSGVVDVTVGAYGYTVLYLKSDGTVWCLARPDDTPTQLANNAVTIGAGLSYAAWLTTDGELWGLALHYQDDGLTPFSGNAPVRVADHVISMSVAGWHLLWVTNDHALWGMGAAWGGWGTDWGIDWGGHLTVPIQLEAGVRAAVANAWQNIYMKDDGTLWTRGNGWGWSSSAEREPATQVDTDVTAFACDGTATWYFKSDHILHRRDGISGTLGPVVDVAGGVDAIVTGTDGGCGFIQQAGFGTAPTITTQPQSASVAVGDAVTLQVVAACSGPMDYRWSKGGVPLAWVRGATYPISYAAATDAGSYTVTVANSAGSVTSTAATVVVSGLVAQTITFSALPDVVFDPTPITLTASSDSGLAVSFTLVSGPATLVDHTLTLAGTGTVTIRASQPGNEIYAAAPDVVHSFEVTATASGFAAWRTASFTQAELDDPNVSGPNAVYGLDGLPNLVKYALGLDPKVNATTGLPVVGTLATDWAYTYTRPSDRSDITYEVEVSTNLQNWTTVDVVHEQVSVNGGQETWQARYPLALAPNVYFRLKITQL